ncbi:MAG: alpha/beta hydrolase [Burkholderiaceae bacterium]
MPEQTSTPVEQTLSQFLSVRRTAPRAWPQDTAAMRIDIEAPPAWPDGQWVPIALHRRGEGPPALLVHGWQSQAADLMPLAEALLDAGFSVWAPDLPGHGHSGGAHLAIPLAAAALREASRAAGGFAVAVGHSYGAASLVHALTQGLPAQRVVLMAAPTHYGQFARFAASKSGLDEAQTGLLLGRLHEVSGEHPDRIDMRRQVEKLTQPALLMHSTDDPVVPATDLQAVAERWPGAQWHPLTGLGHFQLLADPGVLAEVCAFATRA